MILSAQKKKKKKGGRRGYCPRPVCFRRQTTQKPLLNHRRREGRKPLLPKNTNRKGGKGKKEKKKNVEEFLYHPANGRASASSSISLEAIAGKGGEKEGCKSCLVTRQWGKKKAGNEPNLPPSFWNNSAKKGEEEGRRRKPRFRKGIFLDRCANNYRGKKKSRGARSSFLGSYLKKKRKRKRKKRGRMRPEKRSRHHGHSLYPKRRSCLEN